MLERLRILSSVPKERVARLERISRRVHIEKGSILFGPGDATKGFYAVLDGAVRVYRLSRDGQEITLEIADAGSTFAAASLFTDIYHCYAEALKESTVRLIPKDAALEVIHKDIHFAAAWIHILSLEVMHLHQRIGELLLKTAKERIASYILLLSEMQDTASVSLPVHRKSIATLLGMVPETFYRTAKELEDQGIVRFDGRRIEIVDRLALEELVE